MNAKQVLLDVNKALKEGKITITRNGLLSQDFETTNGKLRVESRRYGGGFGMGFTYYVLFKNGKQLTGANPVYDRFKQDINKVYRYTLLHIN